MAPEEHDAVIKRLAGHYQNNVLGPPEPNRKCEDIREKLKAHEGKGMLGHVICSISKVIPQRLRGRKGKRLLAGGLNGSPEILEKIRESDLDGMEIADFGPEFESKYGLKSPEALYVKFPEDKFSLVAKKLGMKGYRGLALSRYHFEENSPFHGINVVLLPDDYSLTRGAEHETLHDIYGERSKPMEDVRNAIEGFSKHSTNEPERDQKYAGLVSLEAEMKTLDELLAFRAEPKNTAAWRIKSYSVRAFAKYAADRMSETAILPNSGIVSRHKSMELFKNEMQNYLETRVDEGLGAIKILEDDLQADKVAKIMISCGPTKKEFESGNYTRPVKELAEWAENGNYEKVLASVPENVS